ncbi:MAG: preprotein translocase subunit SecG [Deltaproteobacteria bacterium]|nr:MAG: preprotein translocase subunit SecG [Deltaproteobacteria bacterium]
MITLITILHIVVSIGLIFVVLLQTGKGADIGAVFGGSSSTIFGSSGAGNFLTRLTTGMAIVFMITSLTLGYFSGRKSGGSLFDTRVPQAEQPARQQASPPLRPAQPGTGPAPQSPAQPAAPQPEKPSTP